MADLIDLGRFRAELRAGRRPEGGVYRLQAADPFVVDEAARTVRFCFSDGSVDRAGDTIAPGGWDLAGYLKNPVVLWAHDSLSPPIGRAANLIVEDLRLMGEVEFAAPEIYEFADLIFRLVKAKYLNAGSVGFLPIDYFWSSEKEREFGIDFERQELLEYSIVPVPANANALAEARRAGIDTRPLVEWAERLLDGDARALIPKQELTALRRLASEPARRAGGEEWHVGAARDLPLDHSEGWDGPAAAKRMLDACGFGGDKPDTARARCGFLVYDGARPELRGSYKLPFADLVGGHLSAVKGGVKAAASRLPQTDAPADVLDSARAVLDHYEERFGMGGKAAPARRKGDGMSETDPAGGGYLTSCKFSAQEECGLADPAQCAVHGPLAETGAGKALLAALRRELRAGFAELTKALEGDPAHALEKALEHVGAAHAAMKDLIVIDPDGDESGHAEAVRGMHAHLKAAAGFLDEHRAARARKSAGFAAGKSGFGDGAPGSHALDKAMEHVAAAQAIAGLLDPEGDGEEHRAAVAALHAHVKAADGFLDEHRALAAAEAGDGDGDEARAAVLDQLRQ